MEAKILNTSKSISVLCIIYGLIVLMLIGPFHIFNFFYLIVGCFLLGVSLFWKQIKEKLNAKLLKVLICIFVLAVSFFLFMELRILSFSLHPAKKGADYVIVLGSQIRKEGPSRDYQARLDSAYEYLEENKDTKVICTGAKGTYEPISEAQGGKDYLLKKGIIETRILLEDGSYNTWQNLENARGLIEGYEDKKIVIVSCDYHLFRAAYIARNLGFKDISVKGGHGMVLLLPQYYTREFFALCKEFLYMPSKKISAR